MAAPQVKAASYEDLFDLPENVIGEILNGRLSTQPRPAPRHARAFHHWVSNSARCGRIDRFA